MLLRDQTQDLDMLEKCLTSELCAATTTHVHMECLHQALFFPLSYSGRVEKSAYGREYLYLSSSFYLWSVPAGTPFLPFITGLYV